jgi:hypothetical protein
MVGREKDSDRASSNDTAQAHAPATILTQRTAKAAWQYSTLRSQTAECFKYPHKAMEELASQCDA